jgi:hypothetical protein
VRTSEIDLSDTLIIASSLDQYWFLKSGLSVAYRGHFLYCVTGSMFCLCGKTKELAHSFKRSKSHCCYSSQFTLAVSLGRNEQQTTLVLPKFSLIFFFFFFKLFDPSSRFIYPAVVSLFIATLYFPPGLGQFLVSTLTTRQQIMSLFSNFTWMSDDLTTEQSAIVSQWTNEYSNIFVTLGIYMATTVLTLHHFRSVLYNGSLFLQFFLTVLASTLPVPSGSLIPIFKIGAAFGRIIGEAMHLWFPEGIRIGSIISPILPGMYRRHKKIVFAP